MTKLLLETIVRSMNETLDAKYWLEDEFVRGLDDRAYRVYTQLVLRCCLESLPDQSDKLAETVGNPEDFGRIWALVKERFLPSQKNPGRLVHFKSGYVAKAAKPKAKKNGSGGYGSGMYSPIGTSVGITPTYTHMPAPDVTPLWEKFPKRANPGVYEKDSLRLLKDIVKTEADYQKVDAAIDGYIKELKRQKLKGDELLTFTKRMNAWLMEDWAGWIDTKTVQKSDTVAKSHDFQSLDEVAAYLLDNNLLTSIGRGSDLHWTPGYQATKYEIDRANAWTQDQKVDWLMQDILLPSNKEIFCPILMKFRTKT